MKINIKKLNKNAIIPSYQTQLSAGADLHACIEEEIKIKPNETIMIPTGISIELPTNYVGLIYARSSLATKKGLAPVNKVGVIDPDYRGEYIVALYNQSNQIQTITPQERIAQLVITPFIQAEFKEQEELTTTQRGTGGFGSTNK